MYRRVTLSGGRRLACTQKQQMPEHGRLTLKGLGLSNARDMEIVFSGALFRQMKQSEAHRQ